MIMFILQIRSYLPLNFSMDLVCPWAACTFSPGLPFGGEQCKFSFQKCDPEKKSLGTTELVQSVKLDIFISYLWLG